MSPFKSNSNNNVVIDDDLSIKNKGGARECSLKINKDSHHIRKSPSTSSSSSLASTKPPPQQQQRHPIIIYTHPPKVIHTKKSEFMALVQKLTGMSKPIDNVGHHKAHDPPLCMSSNATDVSTRNIGRNGDSWIVSKESYGLTVNGGHVNSSYVQGSPSGYEVSNYLYVSDVQHFAQQHSGDFFSSAAQPYYRYSDPNPMFFSPNPLNYMAPSVFEVTDGFQD
ncbi:hypothetical protein GIB67_012625 [Kingdonia uniflora]|uniref:VQ domain-containing protein n=1 Tax=Kingdonia uniflora TaxID=39325 RepID=A0A7J7NFT2_9MAGN|nr:hypothetical protein GIB67_012625 [Kingdonia uniflora]